MTCTYIAVPAVLWHDAVEDRGETGVDGEEETRDANEDSDPERDEESTTATLGIEHSSPTQNFLQNNYEPVVGNIGDGHVQVK